MATILRWLVSFLLLSLSLAVFATQISASEPFVDTFETLDPAKWHIESGTWAIHPFQQLVGITSGRSKAGRITTNQSWSDYRLETDVVMDNAFDAGIGVRRSNPDSTYEVNLRFDNGSHLYDTPEIKLWKVANGQTTLLKSVKNVPIYHGVIYHLKIEVIGNHIQVWVNSILAMDIIDPNNTITNGNSSLSNWTGNEPSAVVRFDNFKITDLSKKKIPVIFIPGIGGSELIAKSNISWSQPDGHGGNFSNTYQKDEKIWVNELEAAKPGNDDYFDVLRLHSDGQTSQADVGVNGLLTSQGYDGLDTFFTDNGYVKGKDYFIFAYDWRKDVRTTESDLDQLVETAKQLSGQQQVNIIAHSMGGLVARNYIANPNQSSKIINLFELGTPHLGAPGAYKSILHGSSIYRYIFSLIPLGISNIQVYDVIQNHPSMFQISPSRIYYDFYNNSSQSLPFPIKDDSDLDLNQETGALNYLQIKTLFSNLGKNMYLFNLAEHFHETTDQKLSNTGTTKVYMCVGTGHSTLGQIHETFWVTWPLNLFPKTDEIFINGDGTVPVYSASLTNGILDLSGDAKIFYTNQKHGDLPKPSGECMQNVKSVLEQDDSAVIASQKRPLEGRQISVDQATLLLTDLGGNFCGVNQDHIMCNISNVHFDVTDNSNHAFINGSGNNLNVKIIPNGNQTNIKIRNYQQDVVTHTINYQNINTPPNQPIEFTFNPGASNPPEIIINNQPVDPTSQTAVQDVNAPTTTLELSGIEITDNTFSDTIDIFLVGSDTQAGILKTEYSLDNGETFLPYNQPIHFDQPGEYTIIFFSTDHAGNQEMPRQFSFIIQTTSSTPSLANTPTPSPTPEPTSDSISISSPTPQPSEDGTQLAESSPTPSSSTAMESLMPSPPPPTTQNTTTVSTPNNSAPTTIVAPTKPAALSISPSPSPTLTPSPTPNLSQILGEATSKHNEEPFNWWKWLICYPLILLVAAILLMEISIFLRRYKKSK